MDPSSISQDRFDRMTMALALCEEFTQQVTLHSEGHITVLVHEKWVLSLEDRLRKHGWRYRKTVKWGPFRIVAAVDSYR